MHYYIFPDGMNKGELKKLAEEHSVYEDDKTFIDMMRERGQTPFKPLVINYYKSGKKIYE